MKEADEHRREMDALRERLTRLSEASLRVNESLDPDTVLQEVMDSARSLTDARFGGITAFDESGRLLEFITSGLPPEEQQRMLDLPEGSGALRVLQLDSRLPEIRDVASQMRSLGFPDLPIKTLLGAPMRHRGEHVGNLYVAEKDGGREFTREDEETLVMFASQTDGRGQRPQAPGRTAGQGRPGGPDQHLAGGCPGVRRHDRGLGVAEPGGEKDLQQPAYAGPPPRSADETPVLRRAIVGAELKLSVSAILSGRYGCRPARPWI